MTTIELLQRIFGTTDLDFGQWSICVAAALVLILVDEIVKIVIRWREHRVGAATAR